MDKALKNLEIWNGLIYQEREIIAQELDLPMELKSLKLEQFSQGGKEHNIAIFDNEDGFFALIIGSTTVLGQDLTNYKPSDNMIKDYNHSIEEWNLGPLSEILKECLRSEHRVSMNPFLLEISAFEPGKIPFSLEHLKKGRKMIFNSKEVNLNEQYKGYRCYSLSFNDIISELEKTEYILPSVDQWEYACRADTKTLFRWGDHCPTNGYPIENIEFNEHQKPNAFGLNIAMNPYRWEMTSDCKIVGGDGGGNICGGAGYVLGWIPLASSYKQYSEPTKDEEHAGINIRRMILI